VQLVPLLWCAEHVAAEDRGGKELIVGYMHARSTEVLIELSTYTAQQR